MEILLAFLLMLVAVGLFLQRPIQIQITHKHEVPAAQLQIVPDDLEEKAAANAIATNMDDIMRAIHEVMGVEHVEQNS